ncbi:UNKNOWN [Stylonychia lemnae]|uniref:DNA replication factor Cdt1 C-terminal domain-containing protein n=1 Tax=Stylonychia lemnae TaxID=5949 RepID=A0A077ZZN9_STYLE|nr:UNKNOWN [Stylonychia lemnae]|eukprot:CDW73993.1 UNKNOWN [Stylonychia lemnae]
MLEDNSKKQQQMSKLAEQIRLHLSFKNSNAIYMNEMTKVLNDSQRGAFISQDELQNLIEELARLVPRWMTIKEIKGKLIKTDKSISGQQVQQWIQNHFKGEQQPRNQ